jgi:hypothetical protein
MTQDEAQRCPWTFCEAVQSATPAHQKDAIAKKKRKTKDKEMAGKAKRSKTLFSAPPRYTRIIEGGKTMAMAP